MDSRYLAVNRIVLYATLLMVIYALNPTLVAYVLGALAITATELRPELRNGGRIYPKATWFVGGLLGAVWGAGLLVDDPPVDNRLATVALACLASAVLPYLRWGAPAMALMVAIHWLLAGFWVVLVAPALYLGMMLTLWTVRINQQLAQQKDTEAALKLAEERLRFANELHDTLGQQLASISMGAELAAALAAKGDDRLYSQLEQLRMTAKQSMRDMRAVAHGYRDISLPEEVAKSVELLADQGIKVTVTGEAFDVPAQLRTLTAWLIRESTTNILKHAGATWANIELSPTVRVRNDVSGPTSGSPSGLASLQSRALEAGAKLSFGKCADEYEVKLSW